MGDTLRAGTHLDVESELNLIKHTKMELNANCATERAERKTMKELGLKRLETKHKCTLVYLSVTIVTRILYLHIGLKSKAFRVAKYLRFHQGMGRDAAGAPRR